MGLKKNIFYSSLLTSANYIFQFITFPYVSRVLGPEGLGIINFTQSYLQYFIMFCSLGIINLGIREISKCQTLEERNECFSKLFKLNILITSIVLIPYLLLIFFVPRLNDYLNFFLVGLIQIVFNAFLIEWFFKGIEKFKYITIRSLVIRGLYVISVFIFVRNQSDTLLYFILTSSTIIINGTINGTYSRRFVKIVKVSIRDSIHDYLKPMFLLGSQALIAFFYVSFNTLFLGFVSTEEEVGYYSIGTKIIIIILMLFSSATSALLPRISSLMANKEYEKVKKILTGSLEILFFIALPMMAIIAIYAEPIVYIISGEAYKPAIPIVALSSPLLLILGLSQVAFVQIMIPSKMDKQISLSCIWGALLSICLNFLIVKKLGAIGSMLIWILAETIVLIRAIFYINSKLNLKIGVKRLYRIVLFYIPPTIICGLSNLISINIYLSLMAGVLFFIIWTHFGLIYILKSDPYISALKKLKLNTSKFVKIVMA